MVRLLVLLVVLVAAVHGHHELYEGHQLYRVAGPAEEFAFLESKLDILSITPAARSVTGQLLEALVRVAPEEREQWTQYFTAKNMPYRVFLSNLADLLRDQEAEIKSAKATATRNGQKFSLNAYYTHDEINDYIDELGEEHSDVLTVINAALSYEGRQIKYVRISTTRFEDLRKPVIVIDAAVHAREWVTPPVAMYIIEQLVNGADKDLLDNLDWVIIPVANPDGYEYSIETDRMWRKTRSKAHPGSLECPGVDGNRNFDHEWGTSSSSADPCSIIYEGPTPFSEPETRVIRDVVQQNINRAHLYISLHSFGNMFLYAWGNNGTLPSNGISLHMAGLEMASAIDKLALENAQRYIVGNAANVLYYTTGTSRDWTRSVGVPLTYTLELPGYTYGFLVPPSYVNQIVVETWAGIAAGGHYVLSLYNP